MRDQVLKLWFADFALAEFTVSQVLQAASLPLRELFLRIAADPDDRHRVCPRRLGFWLADNLGKPAAGWKLERRTVHNQAAWHLVEAPLDASPGSPPLAPALLGEVPLPDPGTPPAEMLAENLRLALQRDNEILRLPLNPDDHRVGNLIATTSSQTKLRS